MKTILILMLMSVSALAALPPPIQFNKATTNASPVADTLSNASGLTNGLIPAARVLGSAGSQSISIGQSADATKDFSVAVGAGATASGTNSTAFGRSTLAAASNSSAFGEGAQAGNADSTAIGQTAVTDTTNQVMIGVANGTVKVPGTIIVNGLVTMGAFASTTNHRWFSIALPCCTNGVSFFTNTYGGDIAFNMKGTGLLIALTTVSTFPTVDQILISATTQIVGPVMSTNDVYMITNTTITGAQGRILP